MKQWGHDELAADLAAHLRHGGERLTWVNMAICGDARPDVWTLRPFSQAQPEMVAYEVKVSWEDLRGDITSGKWQKYMAFSQGVTFAVPHGLCKASDIPKGCGLIIRGETSWRHQCRPTLQFHSRPLPLDAQIRLISARPHTGQRTRFSSYDSPEWRERQWDYDRLRADMFEHARRAVGKAIGQQVATYLQDPAKANDVVERAKAQAEKILERARTDAEWEKGQLGTAWDELALAVGLEKGAPHNAITRRVHQAAERLDGNSEIRALRRGLDRIAEALAEARLTGQLTRGGLHTPPESETPGPGAARHDVQRQRS